MEWVVDVQVQLVDVEDKVIIIKFCCVVQLEDEGFKSEYCQWKSYIINFNT